MHDEKESTCSGVGEDEQGEEKEAIKAGVNGPKPSAKSGTTKKMAFYKMPEYHCWKSMRDRCTKPHHHAFHNYGGRGISICQRWSEFQNFLEDMGARPLGHSLDRIDNDGNYEPGNCRWATWIQQGRNKRGVKPIEIDGVKYPCISIAAEALGIKRKTLEKRISTYKTAPHLLSSKNAVLRGDDNPIAKMTFEKARLLREQRLEMVSLGIRGIVKVLCQKFGIKKSLYWLIISGKVWA